MKRKGRKQTRKRKGRKVDEKKKGKESRRGKGRVERMKQKRKYKVKAIKGYIMLKLDEFSN